jgi:hypothetical protein
VPAQRRTDTAVQMRPGNASRAAAGSGLTPGQRVAVPSPRCAGCSQINEPVSARRDEGRHAVCDQLARVIKSEVLPLLVRCCVGTSSRWAATYGRSRMAWHRSRRRLPVSAKAAFSFRRQHWALPVGRGRTMAAWAISVLVAVCSIVAWAGGRDIMKQCLEAL